MASGEDVGIEAIVISSAIGGYMGLSLVSFLLMKYYKDTRERVSVATVIASLALSTPLFLLFMIPVDVYVVSYHLDTNGQQLYPDTIKSIASMIKGIYYAGFGIEFVLVFACIPFCFFILEDLNEDMNLKARLKNASKFTVPFIGLFAALAFMGSLLLVDETHSFDRWRRVLAQSFTTADSYVSLVVASLCLPGALGWAVYMAFGLAEFPFMMNRGRGGEYEAQTIKYDEENLDRTIIENARSQDYLRSRYDLPANKWSREDRKEYKALVAEERRLKELKENIARPRSGAYLSDSFDALWNAMFALRAFLVLLCIIVSGLLWISLIISLIDKFSHSQCTWTCGYLLESCELYNPLDRALVALVQDFPLDFILFTCLLLFLMLALVLGILTLNSYLRCVKFHTVERQRGMVHPLIMLSWQGSVVLLAATMQFTTVLCPVYSMFGHQFFIDAAGKKQECTLFHIQYPDGTCIPSQISLFTAAMSTHSPWLGDFCFLTNIIFLATFLVATALAIKRGGKRLTPQVRQGAFLFDE